MAYLNRPHRCVVHWLEVFLFLSQQKHIAKWAIWKCKQVHTHREKRWLDGELNDQYTMHVSHRFVIYCTSAYVQRHDIMSQCALVYGNCWFFKTSFHMCILCFIWYNINSVYQPRQEGNLNTKYFSIYAGRQVKIYSTGKWCAHSLCFALEFEVNVRSCWTWLQFKSGFALIFVVPVSLRRCEWELGSCKRLLTPNTAAMPPPADILKVAIEWPGAFPKLMEIDQVSVWEGGTTYYVHYMQFHNERVTHSDLTH